MLTIKDAIHNGAVATRASVNAAASVHAAIDAPACAQAVGTTAACVWAVVDEATAAQAAVEMSHECTGQHKEKVCYQCNHGFRPVGGRDIVIRRLCRP